MMIVACQGCGGMVRARTPQESTPRGVVSQTLLLEKGEERC